MRGTCSTHFKNEKFIHNFGAKFYRVKDQFADLDAKGMMYHGVI
jgi:hypothetical protein